MKVSNPGRRSLFLFLLLAHLLLMTSVAQARLEQEEFARGVVVEKVVSRRDPSKTYVLYLPTAYTPLRKFAILYCFDPLARGGVPVERFKDAAEKYNYIVVGSNNSRNGPNQPLNEIVRDLWEDTHARFSIDDRRVYLAGFSGGARVAISFGYSLKSLIAGVIACGGGFPTSIAPTTPRSFVLFGTAGSEDFNNPEMQSLFRTLEGSSRPVRLTVFEGGHVWLPAVLAAEALEWLEIQAMRAGIRDRDQALIDTIFERALLQARTAEEAKDRYRAYLRYAAAAQDFPALHDVSEVQRRANELKTTKEVRDALKREKEMGDEQGRRIQRVHTLVGALGGAENSFESLLELRDALGDLRKAEAAQPSVNRTIAKRVVESLFIEFFELGNTAIFQKDYARAITNFFVCSEIQPDNARAFYYLARAYALARDKKKALGALQTAADKGFKGLQDLAGEEFAELQNDKRFREILETVKKNQTSR